MAQFDAFENPNRATRSAFPFVIVLQNDVSLGRATVVVAPVAARTTVNADDRAVIPIEINGRAHVVLLQGLAAIPQHTLKRMVSPCPEVAERLPRAIDYLFLGL